MKTLTIIKDNKLVGYVKLQEEVLENLQPDVGMILTQQINRGDSQLVTLKLDFVQVQKYE